MMSRMRFNPYGPPCGRVNRRTFLADLGLGFAGLAMGSMLGQDGAARAAEVVAGQTGAGAGGGPIAGPHFAPRAKNVIWIFLSGGVSHLETFDPKPLLNKFAGKTYDESKLPNPQKSPLFLERSRSVVGTAFKRGGEVGAPVDVARVRAFVSRVS